MPKKLSKKEKAAAEQAAAMAAAQAAQAAMATPSTCVAAARVRLHAFFQPPCCGFGSLAGREGTASQLFRGDLVALRPPV